MYHEAGASGFPRGHTRPTIHPLPLRRVHYTLVAAAGLAFAWEMAFWNLMPFAVASQIELPALMVGATLAAALVLLTHGRLDLPGEQPERTEVTSGTIAGKGA